MRVLLKTYGLHGDVQPLVGLAVLAPVTSVMPTGVCR
jgi:hypothetical protein